MTSVKLESDSNMMDLSTNPAPESVQAPTRSSKSSFKFKNWDEHLFKFLEAGRTPAHSDDVEMTDDAPVDSLDEMKCRYLPPNVPTPSQNTKAISRFLADVRSRVDQSNRDEFVHRKPPPPPNPNIEPNSRPGPGTGSARTDAVKLNRDIQMKYDIVKNEDGPLGKTVKSKTSQDQNQRANSSTEAVSRAAFTERFEAIETHLAVRYVPAPPADFMLRVKHIEEHIIRLEKEYPPWAALHFNQPRRGWPPPPRESIIVIPPHLTSSTRPTQPPPESTAEDEPVRGKGKARAGGRQESSLLRAALDKLEVQKALEGQM
ncbi:hypothetical protein RhiJN_21784 [Ceratobasidium sp. AG-Ba]|nr:hypothetical protein RhiJN_21784 [Ceratobasidium sp. AG-Ba]